MNGSICIQLGGEYTLVAAGRYTQRLPNTFGVKLAKDVPGKAHVVIDWPDFGVPDTKEVTRALKKTLAAMSRMELVYVGCKGGIGRTGTFLALLAKVTNTTLTPIGYTREQYLPGEGHRFPVAIETPQQEAFIRAYDARKLAWTVYRCGLRLRFRAWRQGWSSKEGI